MPIRPLTPADAVAWWHLRLQALQTEPFAFGRSPEEHARTTPEDAAQRFRNLPKGDFTLGAFSDPDPSTPETLLGFVTFAREPGLKERHKGHFYGVYLTPSARGQGLARTLLQAAIDRARQLPGLEQLHLAASPTQAAAHPLNRSLGFEIYGHEPHALKVGTPTSPKTSCS